MVNQQVNDALVALVAERNWAQFHTPENLAKSIAIEAGELLECFQWGAEPDPQQVRHELADVLTYCHHLARCIGADPDQIILEKLEITRKKYPIDKAQGTTIATWKNEDEKHNNWPVVYILDDGNATTSSTSGTLRDIYVGETLNAVRRLHQHLDTPAKQHLTRVRVIIDEKLNKSVCLDLESYLIKMLAGDGSNRVLNRNNGIQNAQYYQREVYRDGFRNLFERLRGDGIFTRSISEIENSELFKLSPFKALTEDQANSVDEVVRGYLRNIDRSMPNTIVIQGDPGTGKTVVAIYMIKLLIDIQNLSSLEDLDSNSAFADLFTLANRDLLRNLRIGLVVPQQSLRSSIKKVFRQTAGLHPSMVLTPFEVGEADGVFDLLLVDETHRLNQRANQSSAALNTKFANINRVLFGHDDPSKTQLDWMRAKSGHQLFLLDATQSVRPADLPAELLSNLISNTRASGGWFQLRTQMRVKAGSDYVSYVRWILNPHPLSYPQVRHDWGDYDFRMFDCVARMRDEIFLRETQVGLSRMVAGFAWEWKTNPRTKKKTNKDVEAFDIEIGETRLRWNGTQTDWIASRNALEEVGSIHTVQGYDLNFVGVIIGPDLRFDPEQRRLFIDRSSYFDKKGKENNPTLGRTYSDDDLLRYITQIYAVLMTRGIRGTYVYVCDPGLREYMKAFIPTSP